LLVVDITPVMMILVINMTLIIGDGHNADDIGGDYVADEKNW
jgi:hypothetical protein